MIQNIPVELEARNNDGERALCIACKNGYFHIALELLRKGAAPDTTTSSGTSLWQMLMGYEPEAYQKEYQKVLEQVKEKKT
ncbi:MAG: ankyrin repeat domain-containing protein [Spirochaetia bacterium]